MTIACRHCRECGQTFNATRTDADFCSTKCRRDWNNRRQQRGAEMYDVFMFMRHERKATEGLKETHDVSLWTIAAQLASEWKAEDDKERDGRRSYQFVPGLVDQGKFAHLKNVFIGIDRTGQFGTGK